MPRDDDFNTDYFTNRRMEMSFRRIFVKKRPFCSPDTGKPEISKLPSFILIEGGIMILHEEAFQEELRSAWEEYERSQQNK
jgi:hypothetical protein